MMGELNYDLLMLHLNLPRVDGVTILMHLRKGKTQPADSCLDEPKPD